MVRYLLPGGLRCAVRGPGRRLRSLGAALGRLRALPSRLLAWLAHRLARAARLFALWARLLVRLRRGLAAGWVWWRRWLASGWTAWQRWLAPGWARGPRGLTVRALSALREVDLRGQVAWRLFRFALHPVDPNNLFAGAGAGAHALGDQGREPVLSLPIGDEARPTLLLVGEGVRRPPTAMAQRIAAGIAAANRRASHEDILATELKRLQAPQVQELAGLVTQLARRWLGPEQQFAPVQRRSRLDVRRTLQANLRHYGGYVLDFRWATRQRPVPKLHRPARLLVIGDVSHSMYHYVSVALYFFHLLNFRFEVESYVFSEHATRASPYLNGPGTFPQKVQALVRHARSWNAGTRFGTSLEEILAEAPLDPHTYVIIATDGKFALGHGELEKIQRQMDRLRRQSRMIIFLIPEAGLGRQAPVAGPQPGAGGPAAPGRGSGPASGPGDLPAGGPPALPGERSRWVVGTFQAGVVRIPIFDLDAIWYQLLRQYADRVYHVRTVRDLVDMVEDLNRAAQAE